MSQQTKKQIKSLILRYDAYTAQHRPDKAAEVMDQIMRVQKEGV